MAILCCYSSETDFNRIKRVMLIITTLALFSLLKIVESLIAFTQL